MTAGFVALMIATDNFGAGGFGGRHSRKYKGYGAGYVPKRKYKGQRPAPKIDHPLKEILSKEAYVNRYAPTPVKENPVSAVEIGIMSAFLIIIILAIVVGVIL